MKKPQNYRYDLWKFVPEDERKNKETKYEKVPLSFEETILKGKKIGEVVKEVMDKHKGDFDIANVRYYTNIVAQITPNGKIQKDKEKFKLSRDM